MHDRLCRRDFLAQSVPAALMASTATTALHAAIPVPGKRKIKTGQIGVGHAHAAGKMEALRKSPDWEVVGVVEEDPQLRAEAEKSEVYRGLTWMNTERLLNDSNVAAVFVESEVDQLLNVARQCIRAGKHIHLDKPPGADLERFRRLLKNADRQRLTVQLGYMYRYNPAVVLLRDLLHRGWLGEIFEFHAVMSKEVGTSKRKRWAQFAGGTMFELGCHLVDLMVGLLGKPGSVTPFNRHSALVDDGLMDNMFAVCAYPRATASIRTTALEIEGFDRRHLVVCGTGGTVHIQPLDAPQVLLALSEPHGDFRKGYQRIDVGEYERYVADLADLAAIVRGEKQTDYDSAHDLATQETLLQACGVSG